ncbi:transmembrane protein, putative (macronuclear) [Tetrahymena thermophila SB210]|uniref:Transmembrane protein, putative n=1 Tax=Tetrahymena thermophila (strain SB210) TaxID=312017 RepID=W7XJX0_TETTS|nr:transmembrane protein, putative [Tetrahymena thermophila SB210]EWS74399.1 transmembrane protein, putative [Tetrahymena thermophila SB210]|eukprot:XP_012653076.1 transmembrane protein, putative [Tetrahymena thermophila SB210]
MICTFLLLSYLYFYYLKKKRQHQNQLYLLFLQRIYVQLVSLKCLQTNKLERILCGTLLCKIRFQIQSYHTRVVILYKNAYIIILVVAIRNVKEITILSHMMQDVDFGLNMQRKMMESLFFNRIMIHSLELYSQLFLHPFIIRNHFIRLTLQFSKCNIWSNYLIQAQANILILYYSMSLIKRFYTIHYLFFIKLVRLLMLNFLIQINFVIILKSK